MVQAKLVLGHELKTSRDDYLAEDELEEGE